MPRARNALVGMSEKVTVAIGSTSSNMRWTLAMGCGIGYASPVVVGAAVGASGGAGDVGVAAATHSFDGRGEATGSAAGDSGGGCVVPMGGTRSAARMT